MSNSKTNVSADPALDHKLIDLADYQPIEIPTHNRTKTTSITLYDASNIDSMPWPNTDDAPFARGYLVPLVKDGTKHYIDNIDAEMRVLLVGKHVIPLLIVKNKYNNAYVCSPYAHYVSLALDSLHLIKNRWMRKGIELSLRGFGKLLRKGHINRLVYVNHWLLSTDLYPKNISSEDLTAITAFLKETFPDSAIAFRSINAKTNASLKTDLQNCGFKLVATRQIYLTNTGEKDLFNTRIIKSDLRLWKENDYEVIDETQLTPQDLNRILKLYKIVAVEHHSHLNPQLNIRFIKLMINQGFLKIKALKKNGKIDGVVGFYERNNIFMCPFFGYDKGHADKNRLYRLLSTLLLLEASKKNCVFHQSSGASFYKKIRRATGHQEFMGLYCRHLPLRQRLPWLTIKTIMNSAGTIFMKKY